MTIKGWPGPRTSLSNSVWSPVCWAVATSFTASNHKAGINKLFANISHKSFQINVAKLPLTSDMMTQMW